MKISTNQFESEEQKVRDQGSEARRNGATKESNPYTYQHWRNVWLEGWNNPGKK